jgi:hypothetical protein
MSLKANDKNRMTNDARPTDSILLHCLVALIVIFITSLYDRNDGNHFNYQVHKYS